MVNATCGGADGACAPDGSCYPFRSVQLGVQLVEAGSLLVGRGKGGQLRVLVMAGQKGQRDGRPRAAYVVVVAVVDRGRLGSVCAAQTIGQNQRGVTGEVGCYQLRIG